MPDKTTLNTFAQEMAQLLAPLQAAVSSPEQAKSLLRALGWELPPAVEDLGLTTLDLQNVIEKMRAVIASKPSEKQDEWLMAGRYAELLAAILEFIESVNSFMHTLATGCLPADYLDKTRIHEQFFTRLLDLLLLAYLEYHHYTWYCLGRALGIFQVRVLEADPSLYQSKHIRNEIMYSRMPQLFQDPAGLMQTVYGWNTEAFNAKALLVNVGLLLEALGGYFRFRTQAPWEEEQLAGHPVPESETDPMPEIEISMLKGLGTNPLDAGLAVYGLRSTSSEATDAGLGLAPFLRGAENFSFNIIDQLFFDINTTLDLQGGVALLLRPGQLEVRADLLGEGPGTLLADGNLMLSLRLGTDTSDPFRILTLPGGSTLQTRKIYFSAGAGVSQTSNLDLILETGFLGNKFIVTAGQGDNFLQSALPPNPMEIDFDLIFGVSSQRGFYIQGGAGLACTFNINKQLGPVAISTLELKTTLQDQSLNCALGLTLCLTLGPLAIAIRNMGLAVSLELEKPGLLGNADLNLGFKPPDGIGISLDAKGIRGSGFLVFDSANQQYAGGLELSFQDAFNLSAVGVLTTKLPDGSKGFALLIIITAEFSSPLALGMNFYLAGVGGLLGLNRTVQVDVLRSGVKSKTLDSILFPTDVVKNMNSIISDLRSVFPPAQDQFLIGPMAMITWNMPPLLRVELGLIMEFAHPVRLAVVGVLKCLVPSEEEALIKLQVNFLGTIDFEAGCLALDAALFDSCIGYGSLKFSLAGDLAIRLSWGGKKDFLLSVGGFHPAYQPPAYLGVPKLARLTISLLTDNPRLILTTYFALTSNTAQFGAELDFYFALSKFKVVGGFGFDALFQFSPFKFTAEMRASLAVKLGSSTILGVALKFALEGPTPWRAQGTGTFSILFFSYSVHFDKIFGDKKELPMPMIEVLPLVLEALEKSENWQGIAPERAFLLVSLNPLGKEPDTVLLHSHGVLTIRQNVLPFSLEISQFGNNLPQDIREITVEEVRINDEILAFEPVQDMFAPAIYQKMSDADRLKAPSYVAMESGIRVAGTDELHADYCAKRAVEYELILSDYEKTSETDTFFCRPIRQGRQQARKTWFEPYLRGSTINSSPLSNKLRQQQERLDGKKVVVGEEEYVIVDSATLSPYVSEHGIISGNQTAALQELKTILQSQPGQAGNLQVVPAYLAAFP